MRKTDRPHSRFKHVYAVVRIDLPVNQVTPEDSVAVVKIMCSQGAAQQEVVRLSEVNRGKACRYFVQTSRLVPRTGRAEAQ